MKFKNTLLAAAMISLPVMAQAQNVTGPYVALGLGGNLLSATDMTGTVNGVQFGAGNSVDFNWGYAGVVSLGWGFGNGLRAEIEGNYRQNDVSEVKRNNVVVNGASGTVTNYGVMANVLYDINLGGALFGVTPYVGVGAGYIWSEVSDIGTNRHASTQYEGSHGDYAGQVIVGMSLPIDAVPGLAVTAEYRFLATAGTEIDKAKTIGYGSNSAKLEIDNHNHSVLLGLRYAFNAAPAVAAVAPAAAAKTFLIFFDWNKADLTARAKQIIGEAAAARGQGVTRLEVNGYTDRSGSDQYNQGLSVRRANAVAAELVRRGVPRNEIVTRGFGEANPLVPTADRVREPQNRRVEIILK